MGDLVTRYRQIHPDTTIDVTYGSSGNFYAQLQNQAPFDLFLSADVSYPRKLVEGGLAEPDSVFVYAVGRIVLWVPNDSKVDLGEGLKALLDPSVKKIAIANPQHAPYGRAAEAALKTHSLWDSVQSRLVTGENIAQAAQFVQSGSADAGIIALSLALAPPMKSRGRYSLIASDDYPRLEQGGVILKAAADPPAARQFKGFITGTDSRAVLKGYGFGMPGDK
jgi:molybdate transport system substrate-binding protein